MRDIDFFQAGALCGEVGDECGEAECLRKLADVCAEQGDRLRALGALDAALALEQGRGDLVGQVCLTLDCEAVLHDLESTQVLCHESLARLHALRGDFTSAVIHFETGMSLRQACEYEDGVSTVVEELERARNSLAARSAAKKSKRRLDSGGEKSSPSRYVHNTCQVS